jgi:predicted MFS family arabinose efflux permease
MGMLCGSLIGGLMMDVFQLKAAFPLGAAVMILTVALFLFSTRSRTGLSNR